MFDLSVFELGVIAVVALLVLGPERLPKAARTVGFYVRKARQSWFSVRAEFERELAAEELKRSLKLDEIHATLDHTAAELKRGLSSQADTAAADADDGGLSPEERARQLEAAGPESGDTDRDQIGVDHTVPTEADARSMSVADEPAAPDDGSGSSAAPPAAPPPEPRQ
ncbi:MAG: Sec-independent protein translocase protein TatB [Aquimonas sp.]|nr:Sec-independent protein translocase protein TatB [Aquimonas sp.]